MKRVTLLALSLYMFILVACSPAQPTGTLEFRANGEGFVREGFVSKDGWQIDFEHVYVTVDEVSVSQDGETTLSLEDAYTVDLAEGPADADPILVDTNAAAPVGFYNTIAFDIVPAADGDLAGQSIVMDGTASKDGETIDFVISVPTAYSYSCGEFVGDERKGIVEEDSVGDVEMTFHFDHVFGDIELEEGDELNEGAPGFDPFSELATDGTLNVDLETLESEMDAESLELFKGALLSLGHVGEGHCDEASLS